MSSQGPAGNDGASGQVGATGPSGPSGASGQIGATGATGPSGLSGQSGQVGATGATGPSGASGQVGQTGPTGATGPVATVTNNLYNGYGITRGFEYLGCHYAYVTTALTSYQYVNAVNDCKVVCGYNTASTVFAVMGNYQSNYQYAQCYCLTALNPGYSRSATATSRITTTLVLTVTSTTTNAGVTTAVVTNTVTSTVSYNSVMYSTYQTYPTTTGAVMNTALENFDPIDYLQGQCNNACGGDTAAFCGGDLGSNFYAVFERH